MKLTTVGQKSQILLGSHSDEQPWVTINISMQGAPLFGGGRREECVLTSLHLAGRITSGCDGPVCDWARDI